jgi:hypothetical protein
MSEMCAVAGEAPVLRGEAARRAEAALAMRRPSLIAHAPLDLMAQRAEFSNLMAGGEPATGTA